MLLIIGEKRAYRISTPFFKTIFRKVKLVSIPLRLWEMRTPANEAVFVFAGEVNDSTTTIDPGLSGNEALPSVSSSCILFVLICCIIFRGLAAMLAVFARRCSVVCMVGRVVTLAQSKY